MDSAQPDTDLDQLNLGTNDLVEEVTQSGLVMEYFRAHPLENVPHHVIKPWLEKEYEKRAGKPFADPDRGIRKLSQMGILIKVSKGVYKYDPAFVKKRELEDFTASQKKEIFERDGYKCRLCGRGPWNGFEIHADHIKAKDKGGEATIDNGQTLCGPHNYLKKNYEQTESGKRMFIGLYQAARKIGDEKMIKFTEDILQVYEKNDVNGHIEWTK